MAFIELEGMEFYAYHGHFSEEQVVGNHFVVDLKIETNIDAALKSDKLEDALDYQQLYQTIKKQMAHKSFLLEHVIGRIQNALVEAFPQIISMTLKVSKINPPLGGKINRVSLISEYKKQ